MVYSYIQLVVLVFSIVVVCQTCMAQKEPFARMAFFDNHTCRQLTSAVLFEKYCLLDKIICLDQYAFCYTTGVRSCRPDTHHQSAHLKTVLKRERMTDLLPATLKHKLQHTLRRPEIRMRLLILNSSREGCTPIHLIEIQPHPALKHTPPRPQELVTASLVCPLHRQARPTFIVRHPTHMPRNQVYPWVVA